ncbi:MAG: hypothetical protein QNJ60_07935 [Xenococcaceae cyanobacterium MO_188.B19]|nr:hypothetical protein [Xenococcaceae cyanobacterium MO_188.B19]
MGKGKDLGFVKSTSCQERASRLFSGTVVAAVMRVSSHCFPVKSLP